jgi:hypothetical protein
VQKRSLVIGTTCWPAGWQSVSATSSENFVDVTSRATARWTNRATPMFLSGHQRTRGHDLFGSVVVGVTRPSPLRRAL